MEVTCTRENLQKSLQMVGRITGSKVTLPVLGNILIQTENGRLKISATDLEIGLTTYIGAKVSNQGSITVPNKSFSELINTISDININLNEDKSVLIVTSEKTKASIRGISADEFPVIPSIKNTEQVIVHGPAFLQAIKQVIVASAQDEARPVLSSVYLKWDGEYLKCVATDGYRLAEKTLTLEKSGDVGEVIVPYKGIAELSRILALVNPEQVSIAVQDNQILFSFEDTEMVSRIIEGKFPDYQKIIPQNKLTSSRTNSDVFKNAIKSANVFARESSNIVKFKFIPEKEIIVSANADQLGEVELKVVSEIGGEEAEASFNIKYLSDAVNSIDSGLVDFFLSGKLQSSLIKGSDDDSYLYIIMPLRTN